MFAFVLLTLGWVVLLGALIVFIVDKIFSKIVCCRLCRNVNIETSQEHESERVHLNKESAVEV